MMNFYQRWITAWAERIDNAIEEKREKNMREHNQRLFNGLKSIRQRRNELFHSLAEYIDNPKSYNANNMLELLIHEWWRKCSPYQMLEQLEGGPIFANAAEREEMLKGYPYYSGNPDFPVEHHAHYLAGKPEDAANGFVWTGEYGRRNVHLIAHLNDKLKEKYGKD